MELKEVLAEIGRALFYPLVGSALLPEEKWMYGAALTVFIGFLFGGISWGISQLF